MTITSVILTDRICPIYRQRLKAKDCREKLAASWARRRRRTSFSSICLESREIDSTISDVPSTLSPRTETRPSKAYRNPLPPSLRPTIAWSTGRKPRSQSKTNCCLTV